MIERAVMEKRGVRRDGRGMEWCLGFLLLLCCSSWSSSWSFIGSAEAQATTLNLTSALDRCVGVFLTYEVTEPPKKIRPFSANLSAQPYSFESTVTLINGGYEELDNWELSIDFQHQEVIAQAENVLFISGGKLPGLQVGNDTRIIGRAQPSLMTSISTAENEDLISANFTLVGTEFGVPETRTPLPANMTLVNDGYTCRTVPAGLNQTWICCTENITAINSTTSGNTNYAPRQKGDITMTYDIMGAYLGSYDAQVTISMDNPMGRLDHWNLSWEWTGGEFIQDMKGAQIQGPNEQDLCVYGLAATTYGSDSSVSFQSVMSCSPNPVVIDLTPYQRNDTTVGIPFCCRNGTILPDLIDPSQSKSNFQLHVRKLPPHMAQDDLTPPINWNIAEGYDCIQPRQVSPTEFDPEALHSASAVASWQVVCNKTVTPVKSCCVSFSAYYNDSLIPCPTCSCGCSSTTLPWNGQTCNPHIPPMLLPYSAVLIPPSNRTDYALQLARLDHYAIPDPLPCPDNCGVSLNWHVYSDYKNGWSARLTVFNWDSTPVADWSASVQLPNAMAGFQEVYSFNGTKVPGLNNTLFMQGHAGYDNNYLLQETVSKDAKENPGKLQSILSFDKRKTPNINVVAGDGFPAKVWFNGEECALPTTFPTSAGWQLRLPSLQSAFVALVTTAFLLLGGADEISRLL